MGPTGRLPTGAVTFAFTDIEGSTARWERDRAAMQDAVRRHDTILRSAITEQGGHVFKTIGDAFCCAFARPESAIASMLAAQQRLAAEDFSAVEGLRVRAALHTGFADERDDDYFGPAVNRVTRLLELGHGGQILMSGVTHDLARGGFPAGAILVDLGSHRLQDLNEPERVWQLTGAGLKVNFPPLRARDTLSNNLPIARTTFVGRERDVLTVKQLLERHRLLTLIGSGGVGKTRLAVQLGAELLDRYSDGVWFADFAPITDPTAVATVVAQALGMSQKHGRRIDESIPPWLARKNLLLIFDNCEHVLPEAAALADAILAKSANVRVLATSREALNIDGEKEFRLDPLVTHDAMKLFADRATLVDQSFAITPENSPILVEICRRLDGIPLAIELAAARTKILNVATLSHRLDERFEWLTGGSRTALPRHKTLRALIDWSYDLSTGREQKLFRKLGVFTGWFSLDAVAAVCATGAPGDSDVLDLLSSLHDKSLVASEAASGRERFRLLESTRAYALERLGAKRGAQLSARHARYFCDQASRAGSRYGQGSNARWLTEVEADLDNYRAALQWALGDQNDVTTGAKIVSALEQLWFRGGLAVEGTGWIRRALDLIDKSNQPSLVARLWRTLAWLCDGKERHEAAHRALKIYESTADEAGQAWALTFVGLGLHQTGRAAEAEPAYEQALATMRRLGNRWGVAVILNRQATLRRDRGELDAARALYMEALDEMKAIGNEASLAIGLTNLAELEFADGNVQRALSLAIDALAIEQRGKNAIQLANIYTCCCAYRIELESLDLASADAREGLGWARRAQNPLAIAIALQHIALLAGMRGMAAVSARLLGYVEARYRELEYQLEVTEEWGRRKLMAALDTLDRAERDALSSEGSTWPENRAFEEAFSVLGERP